MTWIKVKHPITNETHTLRIQIHDDMTYQTIKDHVKKLFKLNEDYDFCFCLLEDKDTLITESSQLLTYISDTSLQLEIVPLEKQTTPLEKQQFDILCDGCYTPIRSQRYRCETCEDFDLCSICKSRVNHNPTHHFQLVYDPSDTASTTKSDTTTADNRFESKSTSITSSTQTIYICDNCESDIVGIRHTCSFCPDFDLCHSCFSIVKQNHPEQHQFTTHLARAEFNKRQRKSQTNLGISSLDTDTSLLVQHTGVQCDHCQSQVVSIRYKCGHCASFDLCTTCEEKAEYIHDKTHAFIKIRYPIQQLPKSQLLPKFTPLLDNAQESASSLSSSAVTFKSIDTVSSVSEVEPSPLQTIPPPIIQDTVLTLNATLIVDMNIPDGTITKPRDSFVKIWKVKNTGNVDWPVGSNLEFNGGTMLSFYPNGQPKLFAVPSLSPGEETCITAELQAPASPGHYTSYFCLCSPDGAPFSDNIWCTIVVEDEQDTSSNKSSMVLPQPSTEKTEYDDDEYDSYSTTTTGDVSNTTVTYTDSQISCFSPDDESINGRYDTASYADGDEEEEEEEEEEGHSEEIMTTTATTSETHLIDDFVFVDNESYDDKQMESSTQSVGSAKEDEKTPTQSLHQDLEELSLVADVSSLEIEDQSSDDFRKRELALKRLVGRILNK